MITRRAQRHAPGVLAAVVACLALAAPAAHAGPERPEGGGSAEPGTLSGGSIVKTGWWARSNEQAPETGLLAPPSAPTLAAPQSSLPVSAVASQAERITAVEFALRGDPGSQVVSVELALKEVDDPTANPGAESASVTACVLTEAFWVEAVNGPWATRPSYDCSLGSAQGERSDDGVWTFDLTSLAQRWLAQDREFAPAVVLLTSSAATAEAPTPSPTEPPAGPPAAPTAPEPSSEEPQASTFQVAFDGKAVGLAARTAKPPAGGEVAGDDGAGDATGSLGAGGVGGGAGLGSGGGLGPVDTPADPVAAAPPGDSAPAADATTDQPAGTVPVAASALAWHDGIGRAGLLVVPGLLLAYLVMLAMGPAGQPVVGGGRRGVSRALDRMRLAGADRLPARRSS